MQYCKTALNQTYIYRQKPVPIYMFSLGQSCNIAIEIIKNAILQDCPKPNIYIYIYKVRSQSLHITQMKTLDNLFSSSLTIE